MTEFEQRVSGERQGSVVENRGRMKSGSLKPGSERQRSITTSGELQSDALDRRDVVSTGLAENVFL